jgi:hypothetical protein
MGSIAELRVAIVAKSRSVRQLGEKFTIDAVKEDWRSQATTLGKKVVEWGTKLGELPMLRNMTVGFEALAEHFIGKTLVCLDDFERLSKRLPADELLGFVSSLKEEKGCKIVLIFNEQKLDGNVEVYNKYREKLVDLELLFAPSAEEAIELVFPRDAAWYAYAREKVLKLDIRNIRLLRKIARLADLIFQSTKGMHEKVMWQALDTIVLYSWCYYEPDARKPTLDFIRGFNSFLLAFKRANKPNEEQDPQQKEWAELLEDFGFGHIDEFDLAIVKVVEQGYIEETGLIGEARKRDEQWKASELEQSFTAAWSLFHDKFADNEQELVAALQSSFKKSVKHVQPINVNGTVRLLRELGKDEVADDLINYYIEQRANEPDVFDLSNYAFRGEVTDATLRARFAEKHKALVRLPSLLDAAVTLGKGQGWNETDLQALDAATEQQFYDLFKKDHGNRLHIVVKGCIRIGEIAGHEQAGKRVRAALERIAADSAINAIRVNRYLR